VERETTGERSKFCLKKSIYPAAFVWRIMGRWVCKGEIREKIFFHSIFFFLGALCLNVRAQCCHHFFCLKNSLITMRTETKGMKGLGEYNLVGFKSLHIFCKN